VVRKVLAAKRKKTSFQETLKAINERVTVALGMFINEVGWPVCSKSRVHAAALFGFMCPVPSSRYTSTLSASTPSFTPSFGSVQHVRIAMIFHSSDA
jgi:hypothetical protein